MKVILFALGACFAHTESDTPITKVVNLLTELKGRITNDEKVEQNVYNKYSCWCETTSQRKADVIHKARDDIGEDGRKVLKLKAKIATLTKKIKKANEDIAESEKSIATLTAIRNENNKNFLALKAELESAIEGLGKAVKVLTGAGTKKLELLQSPTNLVSLYTTLSKVAPNSLSKKDLELAQELVSKFTPTADDGSGSYSPQSATIIGILKNQWDSFTDDLKEATELEAQQLERFTKATDKLKEVIALLQEKVEKHEATKAESQTTLADTDQRLLATTEKLEAEVKFFDETKAACTAKSKAWETRQANRHEELEGVQEALDILTTDDNRSLFNKAIKPGQETVSSFVQIRNSRLPERNLAFKMISNVATKGKSLRLAALAASIKTTGHFEAINKQIDRILKEMKEEEEKDIADRDAYIARTHELNEENKEDKYSVKVSKAVIAKKERVIEENNKEIEEGAKQRQEAHDELEELTDEREEENGAFKEAKHDDETAVGVLDTVLAALNRFHDNKNGGVKLVQEPVFEVSEDQAPDATFSDKAHRKGESKGIINILEMIQTDLKNEITQGIADEAQSQKEFEAQRTAINALVDAINKKETELKESNASRQEEINVEDTNIETKDGEIAATDEELASSKKAGEWLLNNFEKRLKKRRDESIALQNAKGVLSGASVGLIQEHQFTESSERFLQRK